MCNMDAFKVIIFLAFAKCVFCDGASLLHPCRMQDIGCLSNSTQKFLEQTCRGIPQYNIKAIDPLIIPSLKIVADENMGLVFHFKNINVTGLKNQKISDFQMNTKEKSVLLKTKADLDIVGEVVIELQKKSKSFSGLYSAETSIIGAARYDYDLKNDDQGVQHFEVGPETFTCEPIGEPKVTLSSDLSEALLKDPDAEAYKPEYEANRSTLRQRTICKIVELCYADVVHNIRATAKVFPTTAFFEDL